MTHSGEVTLLIILESPYVDKANAGRWMWNYWMQEVYFVRKGRHRADSKDCYMLTSVNNNFAGAMKKMCRVIKEVVESKDIDSSLTVS